MRIREVGLWRLNCFSETKLQARISYVGFRGYRISRGCKGFYESFFSCFAWAILSTHSRVLDWKGKRISVAYARRDQGWIQPVNLGEDDFSKIW